MPATLQDLVTRITRDYLNRTDLDSETVRAIQAAIRHFERKRWPWNQVTLTATAVAGIATIAVPTDFLVLDLLEVQFQSSTYALVPRSFAEIQQRNAVPGGNSLPDSFTLRGTNFIVSPVPDSAYAVNCHYIRRLPELTSAALTATNDWLSACEDLIVYHATKLLWANVLRNPTEAGTYAQLEAGAQLELASYRDAQLQHNIRSTSF